MPQTRTDVKLTDTLEEVLQPIKEALQNLVTNETMSQLLNNLEDKLFKKLTEQVKEISDLKSRCNHLEGRVAILENLGQLRDIQTDDVEQYGRRLCLRVDNVPVNEGETPKDLEDALLKDFESMGLDLPEFSVDRAHRIGRKFEVEEEDENGVVTGVSIRQQVIVRFTSWKSRTSVYRNRKKSKSLRYKVDLTKRRVNLLAKARESTKHMEGIDYVFADINCKLNVKFNDGKFRVFNSETELANIISSLDER